ncbi:MAG: isoprenylcysteine carboxylmethyltransferase family protein [Ignavibacteriaceae bacterium]|jgi:protein-S-isoprenylcysteine O-methyltransferase
MKFGTIFLAISTIWVASEIMLIILSRSTSNAKDHDKGSLKLLNIIIYTSVSLAVTCGFLGIGTIHKVSAIIPRIGLCIIVCGLIIRWNAILTLRKYFTAKVVIQSDHRIIKNGLYRLIRHPSYTGAIISFCGLGLAFYNWLSIIVIVIPVTIAFLRRIHVEEQALVSAFGKEYEDYRKSSWTLFPFLY